jgi:hypothetical protein
VNFNAAALQLMLDKGLSLADVVEIASANEKRADPTAAQRKRRQRAKQADERDKSRRDVTRDTPPNDKDILTPLAEVSEPNGSSPQPRAWALPVGVSLQVWTDFLTNRKRKRQPNTDTAWKSFNDDLRRVSAQTGIPPPKLIEQCVAKGWGAIYDPRNSRDERPSNPTASAVTRILAEQHAHR